MSKPHRCFWCNSVISVTDFSMIRNRQLCEWAEANFCSLNCIVEMANERFEAEGWELTDGMGWTSAAERKGTAEQEADRERD